MSRIATCQCRAFRVIAEGEPVFVNICHCTECQRRTGAPLSSNAYFRSAQIRVEGEHKIFTRDGADGRKLHNHFCPTCGATVCWTLDMRPDHYGVAVGAFNDPNFPAPVASLWERSMYAWVTLPPEVQHFPQARADRRWSLAAKPRVPT